MLTKTLKQIFIFCFILTICSCTKYGFVRFNYPIPAQVKVPDEIKKIALANRSLVKLDHKKSKTIDAITSAEIAGFDETASEQSLKALTDQNNNQNLYTFIIPSHYKLYGSGSREIPSALDWKQVKGICDSSQTDALLVLEAFDSDTDLLSNAIQQQVGVILNGGGTGNSSLPAQVKINTFSYWKLYHPKTKTIIDQHDITLNNTVNCANSTLRIPPPEVLPNMAYESGQSYIQRLLPTYYTVRRDLYKRGKGASKAAFLAAFRKAEVANWEGAITAWKEILKSCSSKNAGRACLNIAVGYEVLGDKNQALQWAKKSYEDYGDELGRTYSNILINNN